MGNRRSITLRKTFRYSYRLLFWIPVVFFSLLLVKNTIPYFSFSPGFSFIATALLQFSSELLRKRKLIHVISGRIYVFVVLGLGAPTGLYMSFFAKGSYWERALFVFMALYWFYTTIKGLQAVLRKEILMHKIWMIRSYSMAMTAVTFRIYHLLFYSIGWGHLENYEISLWISVLGNILFAECFIYNKNQSYFKSINLLIQKR